MLYSGKFGRSTVSDEFNQMCVDFHVEATVQAYPNPGNFNSTPRIVTFRSFNTEEIRVISGSKVSIIPIKGSIQIKLSQDEPLPRLERISDGDILC